MQGGRVTPEVTLSHLWGMVRPVGEPGSGLPRRHTDPGSQGAPDAVGSQRSPCCWLLGVQLSVPGRASPRPCGTSHPTELGAPAHRRARVCWPQGPEGGQGWTPPGHCTRGRGGGGWGGASVLPRPFVVCFSNTTRFRNKEFYQWQCL